MGCGAPVAPALGPSQERLQTVFQKLGSLNSEPVLPSTSYLPATPSAVPASSYGPSSEPPAGERPAGTPGRSVLPAGGPR